MKYDLSDDVQLIKFKNRCNILNKKESLVELKEIKPTRTTKQNAALHVYYGIISEVLNELGHTFKYKGLTGKTLELPYNEKIVKETIWRDVQRSLFDIESTTEINTQQINEIIDVITEFFSRQGVVIEFPCKKDDK